MSKARKFADVKRGRSVMPQQDVDWHEQDISHRSITPTTHKARDAFKDAPDLTATTVPTDMSDAIFYQDTYYHSTWNSPIIHFGINSYNQSIRLSLATHNTAQQPAMGASGVQSNASSKASEYQKFSVAIIPTIYEKDIVGHAASYLNNSPASKVVLIDVFPRTLKGDPAKSLNIGDIELPLTPNAPIITHTVLLYKNTSGAILAIDPNNPQYSGHLQSMGLVTDVNIMRSDHKPYAAPSDAAWVSELQQLQAYNATVSTITTIEKTGPNGIQYRDCVDIAVKLAALLDQDPTDYTTHDEIMRSQAVNMVSNNKDITGLTITGKALRIKQVSDLNAMKTVHDELQKQLTKLMQDRRDAQSKLEAATKVLEIQYHQELKDMSAGYISKTCRI